MTTWQLALDESGTLGDPSQRVLLGGLLVNVRDTLAVRRALKHGVELSFPGVPWPPHATDLNIPAMRAVYAAQAPAHASRAALAAVRFLGPRIGDSSRRADVLRADDELRDTASWIHGQLFDVMRRERAAMQSFMASVADHTLSPGRAWLVAAWEDAVPGPGNGPLRYQRLFRALTDRVELLLGGGNDRQVVQVHSAHYAGVEVSDLAQVVQSQSPARSSMVDWFPLAPQEYRSEVHPLLVMADFACNQLRRNLDTGAWATVSARLQGSTGLPAVSTFRTTTGGLPTISALGVPAAHIDRALAGESKMSLLHELWGSDPMWTGEQAAAWVDVLGAP